MKIINLFLIFLSLALTTCIEPFSLEAEEETPKLVIYGLITDKDSCFVNLSYTTKFSPDNTGDYTPATASRVWVEDQIENEYDLQEVEPGKYVASNLKGQIGNTYTLNVDIDGKRYSSLPEKLIAVPPIDAMGFTILKQDRLENGILVNDVALDVNVFFRDPLNEKNYYKWKWLGEAAFRLNTENPPPPPAPVPLCYYTLYPTLSDPYKQEINVVSDQFFNGNNHKYPAIFFDTKAFDYRFRGGVSLLIAQYSLTKNAFEYWDKIRRLVVNQGSVFDPAPFQALGNMYNSIDKNEIVLGFFGASGVVYRRYQFEASDILNAPCIDFNAFEFCNDCRKHGGNLSDVPPPYWKN
jgi:hypothetical protein